jgi:dienelactone hydrolase
MRLVAFLRSLVLVNTVACGLFGLTFGVLSGNLYPWLIGGVLIGAAFGVLGEYLFRSRRAQRIYRLRMVLVLLFELLLVVYLVIPLFASYRDVYPERFPATVNPGQMGLAYEDVRLRTQDGIDLAAWYIPSRNGAAIIAVHGFNGNRTHVIYHASALAQHGYGVLAFDMRAHGESGGDRFASAWTSDLDVLAALDYLQHRPQVNPNRIGALGLSSGAHAIIYGAARSEAIRALIAEGTGGGRVEDAINPLLPEIQQYWITVPMVWVTDRCVELWSGSTAKPPIREQVKLISPRPILFIAAGQADYEISIAHRYADSAGPTAQVWEIPEAGHVAGIFVRPEEYQRRMLAFFDASLSDH